MISFMLNFAQAENDLKASQRISAQGMRVQNERLKIIAQNIANSSVTGKTADDLPYQRKMLILKNKYDANLGADVVQVDKIIKDKSEFVLKYEPFHPAADGNGYVKYPNVQLPLESVDAKEAQRTYEANLGALEIARSNQMKVVEAMK